MSSSISARENQLIHEIESRDMMFFTPEDAARFLSLDKNSAYNLLSRMKDKELVKRIESGKYILSEVYNRSDVYDLASNILDASYIGFFSALHFHGLTDQVPQKIQVVTTKRKNNDIKIQERKIEFTTFNKKHFFGYNNYDRVVASDPEKTVIDSLRLPGRSGDLSNITNLDFRSFDTGKLVDYAEKTGNSSVASRLGVLMDEKGIEFDEERLQKTITHYSLFDPSGSEENPVKKWKLYLNSDVS